MLLLTDDLAEGAVLSDAADSRAGCGLGWLALSQNESDSEKFCVWIRKGHVQIHR